MNNFKAIMKQKVQPGTLGTGNAPGTSAGGLLKKKPSTEVKPVPNLMKRLTGK